MKHISHYNQFRRDIIRESNLVSDTCIKCGEEYWGESDICDDCKDSDLEEKEVEEAPEKKKKQLPFFGVPTTKSQNNYYL